MFNIIRSLSDDAMLGVNLVILGSIVIHRQAFSESEIVAMPLVLPGHI